MWLSVVPAGVVVVRRVFGFAARYNTCISAQTATAENTAEGWCVTVRRLTVVNTSLQNSIKADKTVRYKKLLFGLTGLNRI